MRFVSKGCGGSTDSLISLDSVLSSWGSLLFDIVFWSVSIELHEFCKIEFGLLEDLDFFDKAAVVIKWEDFGAAFFMNVLANLIGNQDFDELFEAGLLNTSLHDLHHLLSNLLLL